MVPKHDPHARGSLGELVLYQRAYIVVRSLALVCLLPIVVCAYTFGHHAIFVAKAKFDSISATDRNSAILRKHIRKHEIRDRCSADSEAFCTFNSAINMIV